MARRDWRSRGKREFRRSVVAKRKQFYTLYERGLSKGTIASVMGLSREDVDALFEILEEGERRRAS